MKPVTMTLTLERTLATSPREACRAWLDPKVPGTPWNMGDVLVLQPKVGGFFYWLVSKTPHYGRFLAIKKGSLIEHTWMSPYTEGLESTVTVRFEKAGAGTRMTLVHAGLPNSKKGRAHREGWSDFLDAFPKQFERPASKTRAR